MAKARKMFKTQGFWISHETPEFIFANKLQKEFDTLRTIILTCGASFARVPDTLKAHHVNRLVEIGWLKFAHGRWWQVPLNKILPAMVTGQKKHRISLESLQQDVRALLHKLDNDYLTSIHTAPQAPKNQRMATCGGDEKTRQLDRGSRHLGGIAISIFMVRYGCSKGYVSKLRRLCERDGLATFDERFRVTKWDTAAEGRAGGAKGFLFDGYGGAWEQLTSEYKPHVGAQMRTHIPGFDKNGWRKIEKADQRLVSNFVTGGAYEM